MNSAKVNSEEVNSEEVAFWAVVPAAGVGRRMRQQCPKQYLDLLGKTILERTLDRLLGHAGLSGVVVAISEGDAYWPEIAARYQDERLHVAAGGKERCDSVLNALISLKQFARDDDWVLVHDAARPCLSDGDLNTLITRLQHDEVGGILGVPVADTLKRVSDDNIDVTVDRSGLWRALTPQMFRLGLLSQTLSAAIDEGVSVTDESSAIEWAGYNSKMVEGSPENIKITLPQDLWLAACYLNHEKGI